MSSSGVGATVMGIAPPMAARTSVASEALATRIASGRRGEPERGLAIAVNSTWPRAPSVSPEAIASRPTKVPSGFSIQTTRSVR